MIAPGQAVFSFGPLGAMRALPSPALGSGPQATSVRVGATHRALNGTPTIDLTGRRRTWVLSWPYLDADTFAFLDAAHAGMMAEGPLYLLDPMRPNMLSERVAATGSARRSAAGFTPSDTGIVTYVAGNVPPGTGLPLGGGLQWVPAAAGGQLLTTDMFPLTAEIPFTMSAWCTGPTPVFLRCRYFNASGTLLMSARSPTVTPGAAWVQLTQTTALPTATAPAGLCTVNLIAEATPAGTAPLTNTTGWQAELGSTLSPFAPGGGAARVLVESLTTGYPLPGSYAVELTLLEV